MNSVMKRAMIGACLAMLAGSVAAQDTGSTDNLVATKTDWSVFEYPPVCVEGKDIADCRKPDEKPTDCWGVSQPMETVNTRDGKEVAVERDPIYLYVTYWTGKEIPEVSFYADYPFASGSEVVLTVDGTKFNMIYSGEYAYGANSDDDVRIVEAMKQGASAIVTGVSERGTQTRDTFSLRGFTAAMTEAGERCK